MFWRLYATCTIRGHGECQYMSLTFSVLCLGHTYSSSESHVLNLFGRQPSRLGSSKGYLFDFPGSLVLGRNILHTIDVHLVKVTLIGRTPQGAGGITCQFEVSQHLIVLGHGTLALIQGHSCGTGLFSSSLSLSTSSISEISKPL